ncbi:hypothetical protein MMC30_003152 [Trapelia coarctata]|nr:hypothetical protein [Trapelia coarctata]
MPRIQEEDTPRPQADIRRRRDPQEQPPQSRRINNHATRSQIEPTTQDMLLIASERIEGILKLVLGWVFQVIGGAFRVLKTPLSYVLAIYALLGLMVFTRSLLTSSIYSALSPICRIPGSSLLPLPMCKPPMAVNYKGEETPPVEFDQLMGVQSRFEDILEQTADGISLPLDMKRSEASIRDLRQVVRYSQLRSKNELVLEFDGFIETARIASYDLQKFTSHVGRSVDNVLATAKWTTRVIQGIAERDSSRGAVASFISDKILAPFQPLKFTEEALLDQYIQHTRTVEGEIHRLIEEAQALLLVLQNLEDRLDVIHGISIRDNKQAQYSKDEVLSQLWTMLGGNRSKLGKFDSELKLLQQVNTYRQNAFGYVAGTILKLQAMETELEGLRERVGSPELLRDKADIPLSVHIENIQLGVERLELGRSNARRLENEYLTKRLDRAEESREKTRLIDITVR